MDNNAAIQAIDRYLSANSRFFGGVLIAEKGQVLYEKSFGYAVLRG